MFIGILTIFILPDFPHNSRGFSAEERKLAVLRMTEDAGESDSDDTSSLKALAGAFTDHRLYVMALTLASDTQSSFPIRRLIASFADINGHRSSLQRFLPDPDWHPRIWTHRNTFARSATFRICNCKCIKLSADYSLREPFHLFTYRLWLSSTLDTLTRRVNVTGIAFGL